MQSSRSTTFQLSFPLKNCSKKCSILVSNPLIFKLVCPLKIIFIRNSIFMKHIISLLLCTILSYRSLIVQFFSKSLLLTFYYILPGYCSIAGVEAHITWFFVFLFCISSTGFFFKHIYCESECRNVAYYIFEWLLKHITWHETNHR